MKIPITKHALFVLILVSTIHPSIAATDAWVTSDRVDRRTCPDLKCGIVGYLMFREKVTILEEKDGWARVSQYYDASCWNGKSDYVDSGNSACSQSNGIVRGEFAEWVPTRHLSGIRPDDPGADATGDYAIIKGSDDYRIYKDAFAKAAAELIKNRQCTPSDFTKMGGWMKSTSKKGPVYFAYCGGTRAEHRIYLNAETGAIYR